ncbi:MAG TPA: RsmG family class I SAM-dependent methyltransferase [Vicinamibacterales bacterium]|nr:RsmG family class I SAM-dependent methyltransferase [Vicinamibacterales bacterium]
MSADAPAIRTRISARFDELGLVASPTEIQQLTDYFCLLAKWNSTINLTALPVDTGAISAIDRLLVEPTVASRLVFPADELLVDLGSGGGSPGFPLKVGAPRLRTVLVESRERKCAFLREVARSLAFSGVEVANTRFEALQSRADLAGKVDLVSFRAVRADDSLWSTATGLLKPGGRAFWFGGPELPADQALKDVAPRLALVSSHTLVPAGIDNGPSRLAVLQKTA